MPALADNPVRRHLVERRSRLAAAVNAGPDPSVADRRVVELIQEVDAALERVDGGSFGWCDVCHEPIEADRLLRNPLVRVCLGCLSPDERQLLERDLETAAGIQAALLPPPEQALNGWRIAYRYEPAGAVGGDYCDVIPPARAGADVHVVFGDVAGKGVSASLLMTHLHATFRALAALDLPLGDLVARANRLFNDSTPGNMYATLVIGRLGRAGSVEIANLAHCSPLVWSGSRVASLPATGYPLGLFPSATITDTHRLDLTAGDRLLLYTDGLSEAENASGEAYGEDRISRIFGRSAAGSPASTIQACLADWRTFRNTGAPRDDVSAMAVCRDPTA